MKNLFKTSIVGAVLFAMVALGTSEANADPVTFSTSGTFTCVLLARDRVARAAALTR